MRTQIFILFLILPIVGWTQATFNKRGVVIDAETKDPLPYVSIFTLQQRHGTLSRQDGSFEISDLRAEDSVVFNFTGYQKQTILASEIPDTIQLETPTQLIGAVSVISNNSILYDMLARAKQTKSTERVKAKTYFELETFENDQQLELFQGFYNGAIHGYDIEGLELKAARFGLKRNRGRYFMSRESSKALYLHQLFEATPFFPTNPLELNRRQMKRDFNVHLDRKYRDAQQNTIYVLRFYPKCDDGKAFSGLIWMDSLRCAIQKIELTADSAVVYPFEAFFKRTSLDHVRMKIVKSYETVNGHQQLKSVDFDYSLQIDRPMYVSLNTDNQVQFLDTVPRTANYEIIPDFTIQSKAILFVFDSEAPFILPRFDFPKEGIDDYRKMGALGSTTDFWSCYTDFKIPNNLSHDLFLQQKDVTTDLDSIYLRGNSVNFDLGSYTPWSEKRVILKESPSEMGTPTPTLAAWSYLLKAQILLEINDECDSMAYSTTAVLDAYSSYYNLEINNVDLAFINIYFDWVECKRRELEQLLEQIDSPSAQELISVHEAFLKKVEKESTQFFKEVDRGRNLDHLNYYNKIISNQLGINNIELFQVMETTEKE